MSDAAYIIEAIRIHVEKRAEHEILDCDPEITISDKTLYFALYYDDIEIVNPIGSSTKKHKLGNLELWNLILSLLNQKVQNLC